MGQYKETFVCIIETNTLPYLINHASIFTDNHDCQLFKFSVNRQIKRVKRCKTG